MLSLSSHTFPCQPFLQMHLNFPFISSMQVPPFLHGLLSQPRTGVRVVRGVIVVGGVVTVKEAYLESFIQYLRKNFRKTNNLLITSNLLFSLLSFLCRAIASFSLKHRRHRLELWFYDLWVLIISQDMFEVLFADMIFPNIRLIVLSVWYLMFHVTSYLIM